MNLFAPELQNILYIPLKHREGILNDTFYI